MGKALQSGMVLVMSLWDDYSVDMLWLDSTYPTTESVSTSGAARGPCATNSGNPSTVESQHGSAKVIFSNIKVGDLGSTYGNGNEPVPGSPGGGSTSSVKPPLASLTTVKPPPPPPTTSANPPPKSCPVKSTTPLSPPPTTSAMPPGGGGTVPKWGQCGGQGYNGPTICASGSTCQFSKPWYSQCL